MISKEILLMTFVNKPSLIFFTDKWFQAFLSNTIISIDYKSFVCTKLNGLINCHVSIRLYHQSFIYAY